MTDAWKTMSIRLPLEMAAQLEVIAKVDRTSVVDEIREAVDAYIVRRHHDPVFIDMLKTRIARDMALLERIQEPPSV